MSNKTLWKIILSGPRIQGIGLRDKLTEYCNRNGLLGRIKNLDNGDVEIIFLEEEKTADEFLEGINKNVFTRMNNEGILKEIPTVQQHEISDKPLADEILANGKFYIEEADDLQEIVWALKGAGEVFSLSANEVRRIVRNQAQEKQTRLDSLLSELGYTQLKLASIKEKENQLIGLRHFIEEPMIENEEDIDKLVTFYYEFMDFVQRKEEADKETQQGLVEEMSNDFEKMINLLNKHKNNTLQGGGLI